MQTRSQLMAQKAFSSLNNKKISREYRSFAKKFPSLVHSCGLAQAIAFGQAKGENEYLSHLAEILTGLGHHEVQDALSLGARSRELDVSGYILLSRDAIQSADWLKRYVEALYPEQDSFDMESEG